MHNILTSEIASEIMTDISQLSRTELQDLQNQIAARLRETEQQALQDAKAKIGEMAQGLGRSVQQLLIDTGLVAGGSVGRGFKAGAQFGKKVQPIFANPANPAENWSGRGRQPHWVKVMLNSGKTLDELRIAR
jgi:DNA-binding protein H-NS